MQENNSPQENMEKTPLFLTEAQKGSLAGLLNIELRNPSLTKDYADRLNDMYKQLLGKNHDVWEKNFGKQETTTTVKVEP